VTILLVSHDLDAVEKMCDDALWLEHGVIRRTGPATEVVAAYRASMDPGQARPGVGGAVRPAAS
jgi:ABC-type polysaccharide/polyol phosphate transport system ATPase subunit